MIYKINLPHPSFHIKEKCYQVSHGPSDLYKNNVKTMFENSQSQKINNVIGTGIRNLELQKMTEKEYGEIFAEEEYFATSHIMLNLEDSPACVAPHIDVVRSISLTYPLMTGGDETVTTYYKTDHSLFTPKKLMFMDYQEANLKIIQRVHTAKNTWYAYPSQEWHSVENITERCRLLFCINFTKLSWNDFLLKYKDLIFKI